MKKPRPNQKALRYVVFRRDKGICSSCGFDCEALRVQLLALPYYERAMKRQLMGIPKGRTSYWDVHHIKALTEGGTDTLGNCTTLCFRCHSKETAQLAAARASARHGAPMSGLEEVFG